MGTVRICHARGGESMVPPRRVVGVVCSVHEYCTRSTHCATNELRVPYYSGKCNELGVPCIHLTI